MYFDSFLPFLQEGELSGGRRERIRREKLFIPMTLSPRFNGNVTYPNLDMALNTIQVYHVLPLDLYVLNEPDIVSFGIKNGVYGDSFDAFVLDIDYYGVASRIKVSPSSGGSLDAFLSKGNGYDRQSVVLEDLINLAGSFTSVEDYSDVLDSISIEFLPTETFRDFINKQGTTNEAFDFSEFHGNGVSVDSVADVRDDVNTDVIYKVLNAYFAEFQHNPFPKADEIREVVPLLIGPTGVFKSATVKELCRKYNYRMVDFRVAFTGRLDYTGLYDYETVDGVGYSYACPMEEIVTCSDGFRTYCKQGAEKIDEILSRGYLVVKSSSDGNSANETRVPLTSEQVEGLKKAKEQYEYYMRTPVLFFDEITRCKDAGVQGILVTLLNQKILNGMTLYGCAMVAATNANLPDTIDGISSYDDREDILRALDTLYDVTNSQLDVAFSNRFQPLQVKPQEVADRWFDWAKGDKERKNGSIGTTGVLGKNIHPDVISFLESHRTYLYNTTPVVDKVKDYNTNANEQRIQSFPNYRTWDMVSDYLYTVGDSKIIRPRIINGLVSTFAGEPFIDYLCDKLGYSLFDENAIKDPMTDFVESTLDAGIPSMIVAPTAYGKTSRIKAYCRKLKERTGLDPIFIPINLSEKASSDLMGPPIKTTMEEFVTKDTFDGLELGSVTKELQSIMTKLRQDNPSFGTPPKMTLRAPSLDFVKQFKAAVNVPDGAKPRPVIVFFDECNRVINTSIMSAIFEATSDHRLFGVDFSHMKDYVKIVAACNLASTEDIYSGADGVTARYGTSDAGDDVSANYNSAGSIDPALAARFAVYWKKSYDIKDAEDFLSFFENEVKEGREDELVYEFLKSRDPKDLLAMMISVEERTLEQATPSTRAYSLLSTEIRKARQLNKYARQHNDETAYQQSAYSGSLIAGASEQVLFQTLLGKRDSLVQAGEFTSSNVGVLNEFADFAQTLFDNSDTWESRLTGARFTLVNPTTGEIVTPTAAEVIDSLPTLISNMRDFYEEYVKNISQLQPVPGNAQRIEDFYKAATSCLALVCRIIRHICDIDAATAQLRQKSFETIIGRTAAQEFAKFFNDNFGKDVIVIEIPELSDTKKISPYLSRVYSEVAAQTQDKQYARYSDVINAVWDYFKNRESEFTSLHCRQFIRTLCDVCLQRADRWVNFFGDVAVGKVACTTALDGMSARAEDCDTAVGNEWILDLLYEAIGNTMSQDINSLICSIRASLDSENRKKDSGTYKPKARLL